MLQNYFKVAIRNLLKNKTASAINIFGLTIGLTCCLLISLYIRHEVSFDDFQKNGDRIARVIMEYSFDGGNASGKGNYTSVRVAPVLQRTFPEVEAAVRMGAYERVIHYNDKMISEKHFMYTDPSFVKMFSFKLKDGDAGQVLNAPYNVVLTESTAKKYFGEQNAIGKAFQVGNDSNLYRVTGVMQDLPDNSQIRFDFLASFSSLGMRPESEDTYWNANYTTYLLLNNKQSIAGLQAKLPAFMKKEMQGANATINFYLEQFNKVHLYSPYDSFVPNNSISYMFILGAVALLILIIACSTYINLSTARSLERAKEVGVRKVIGAGKSQLFWQFIGESVLICLAAVVLSLFVASALLPFFNKLTNTTLTGSSLLSLPFISFLVLVVILVSLLAGAYPSFILADFRPVTVLKGSFKNTGKGQTLRRSLIVFQFAISVFLIISTFIVQRQLYFIQHAKLGYDREHIVVLPMDGKMAQRIPLIKQQLKSNSNVLNVSYCYRTPVEGGGGYNMRSATMPETQQIAVTANPIDEDFVPTVGMQIIAGENITLQDVKEAALDSNPLFHVILNESAARQLGWSAQDAVGKRMFLDATRPSIVKAVVKDFHFRSMREPIKPFVLFPENSGREIMVKINGANLTQTIAFIESKWKELVPHRPFEYHFMDEDYNELYNAETRLGKVMDVFAAIAIILACLGLLGLSAYSAQQRTKEIGVRKVLGASVSSIVIALSRDFIRLTVLAIVIAFPVAWWATTKWLEDFSYRTDISWSIYVIAAMLTIVLAVLTVSLQTIKAAMSNPVKSLRTE